MKVLLKRVNQAEKVIELEKIDLKNVYSLLDCELVERVGFIKEFEDNNIDVLIDEEGKLVKKKNNILICNDLTTLDILDILVGDVLFVGVDEENWIGLNNEQIELITSILSKRIIYNLDGTILNVISI